MVKKIARSSYLSVLFSEWMNEWRMSDIKALPVFLNITKYSVFLPETLASLRKPCQVKWQPSLCWLQHAGDELSPWKHFHPCTVSRSPSSREACLSQGGALQEGCANPPRCESHSCSTCRGVQACRGLDTVVINFVNWLSEQLCFCSSGMHSLNSFPVLSLS